VDPDTLDYIKQGVMDSTVSQKPYTMGYVGLKALDEAHRSHKSFRTDYTVDFQSPFPAFVDTGSALITKDNVSLYNALPEPAQ
jgi:ribose transport system substrate-binding protein